MALSVQTNVAALTAQRNLSNSTTRLAGNLERLSTGLRINRAADDASGLVVSENQKAQISGLNQAIENTDRAVNLVQTAESGLGEINAILLTIRQLTVDSANAGANDADYLAANQADIANLLTTINQISDTTKFGTINVLNGDSGLRGQTTDASVTFLRATDTSIATNSLAVNVTQQATRSEIAAGSALGVGTLATAETLSVNGVDISLEAGLNSTQVVNRINEFSGQTGVFAVDDAGTLDLRTEEFGSQTEVTVLSNVAAAAGTSTGFGTAFIRDTSGVDITGTIAGDTAIGRGNVLTGDDGLGGSGVSIQLEATVSTDVATSATGALGDVVVTNNSRNFQVGAFETEFVSIAINQANADALGVGVPGSQFTSLQDIDVQTFQGAQDSIEVVDEAIKDVSNRRGELGAFQRNTLRANQSNLRSELQNLQEAESTVRDTDFQTEIAEFTNEQIRQQASTTVLGLANQSAQAILALLQA